MTFAVALDALLAVAAAGALIEALVLLLAIRRATRARHGAERPSPAPFAALPTPPAVAAVIDGAATTDRTAARPADLVATVETALAAPPVREVLVTLPEGAAFDAAAAALDARFALHTDGRRARSITHPGVTLLRTPPSDAGAATGTDAWMAAGTLEHLGSDLLLPLPVGARVLPGALERAAQALAAAPDAAAAAAIRTPRGRGFRNRLKAIRHARSVAAPQLAFGEASAHATLARSAALLRRTSLAEDAGAATPRILLLAETLIEGSAPRLDPLLPPRLSSGARHPLGTLAALLARPATPRLRTLMLLALALLVPIGGGDLRSAGVLAALLLVQGGLAAAGAADLALLLRPDLRGARHGWALLAAAPAEALGVGWLLGDPAP